MPALDFTEIPPAHAGSVRDQFELFARDVLEYFGFETVRGPDRGPDAGRDLIVRDIRTGASGSTVIDFLVSCKHKAHSGNSVSESEDQNFRDRIGTHSCQGLIAFYSTVPSGTLATHLAELKKSTEVLIFDAESIEKRLLASPPGRAIAARYFPKSFSKWVVASQYSQTEAPPRALPVFDRMFLREPHSDLPTAKIEAQSRGVPVFAVVYDPNHSQRSRIDYCLGTFMEWETTKRMVDENFVPAVGPSTDEAFLSLVPSDDPLEECRLVIFTPTKTYLSASTYANPQVARGWVLAVIEAIRDDRDAGKRTDGT
ncbi:MULTISPECIES: restriction endonuclease [unclassified Rhizobium]|uniref:restriction endonuclease n=1 Tax=unclassified Rhizobium TaxID=2613769 RepID=UPI0025CC07E9|nr:restriction endonuclease [Rhizobium sp. UBA1881]